MFVFRSIDSVDSKKLECKRFDLIIASERCEETTVMKPSYRTRVPFFDDPVKN